LAIQHYCLKCKGIHGVSIDVDITVGNVFLGLGFPKFPIVMGHILNGFGIVDVFDKHKCTPGNGAARPMGFVRTYVTYDNL
jgi:hypothetical protein